MLQGGRPDPFSHEGLLPWLQHLAPPSFLVLQSGSSLISPELGGAITDSPNSSKIAPPFFNGLALLPVL